MTVLPAFQPQNPALNGYSLGWASCTCYAGAMAAAFDQGKSSVMTGEQVRKLTGDTIGGTTLAQVDMALLRGWDINVATSYGLAWSVFAQKINEGRGAILQGWYGPIADSRYDAGGGFRSNHAVTVLPGWIVMDPLADGRRTGIYKYHGEAYPQALLKDYAGRLNLSGTGYRALGAGLVYASFTHDKVTAYHAAVDGPHGVYEVIADTVVSSRVATGTYSASCTAPRLYRWPGHTSQSLVQLLDGSHKGRFIRSSYAKAV